MKISIYIFFVCTILFGMCLYSCRWTETKRKEFETNCTQTETFSNDVFIFKGFKNEEFDSVWVKEFNGQILLDSFKILVNKSRGAYEDERHASFNRAMHIKYQYQFIVSGEKPYQLANMKMIMWSQYTMASEGYGCVMGDYTIDGKHFEHDANPTFIKRVNTSAR